MNMVPRFYCGCDSGSFRRRLDSRHRHAWQQIYLALAFVACIMVI